MRFRGRANAITRRRATAGGLSSALCGGVTTRSNNVWFAAVENLRQAKLFLENVETQLLFHTRSPEFDLPNRFP